MKLFWIKLTKAHKKINLKKICNITPSHIITIIK